MVAVALLAACASQGAVRLRRDRLTPEPGDVALARGDLVEAHARFVAALRASGDDTARRAAALRGIAELLAITESTEQALLWASRAVTAATAAS